MDINLIRTLVTLFCLAAFLGIVWWVLRRKNTARWKRAARMPLDDVHPQEPRKGED